MIKMLIGDKGNVDFDSPVKMSKKQQDDMIGLLRSIFSVVEVDHTNEHRTDRLGSKPRFFREWTADELEILLKIEEKDTEKVAEELGRTWMSVDIKRGSFIPEYLYWLDKKGVDLLHADTKKLIKEFLKEKEDIIFSRRKKKSFETAIRNRSDELSELRKEESTQKAVIKNLESKTIPSHFLDSEYDKLDKIESKIRNTESLLEENRRELAKIRQSAND